MAGALDVVMVTTSYPRTQGDFAGHFVASLATEIAALDHRVTVIAPHAPGLSLAEENAGVQVRRVRYASDSAERLAYGDGIVSNLKHDPLLARTVPGLARALRAAVREHPADVVHAHWAPTAVLAGLGDLDAPVALSLHGSDVTLAGRGPLFRSLLARGLAAADAAIVVAAVQRDAIVKRGLDRGPIEVVPSGIPLELTTRERTSEATSGLKFLFVGRLVKSKGVSGLLEAFALVSSMLPDATLTIAGKGPLAGDLRDDIRMRSLDSRVELLGEVTHARALELMGEHDALVLPSNGEGSPLVVTEALALGTPVIGTPVGAVPDLVGDAGIIVPVGNTSELAEAMRAFAHGRERYALLGAQARVRMAAEYGWPGVAKRVLDVYATAIERRGARA